jgi:hypothetical protein
MVAVPALTPITSPVEAFTLAIVESLLDQVPPETVDEKAAVPATQID